MTAHVHRGSFHDRLADNSLLSCPEVDAVRAEFGDLTGSQIEVKLAERQGHLNEAHDELSRLIWMIIFVVVVTVAINVTMKKFGNHKPAVRRDIIKLVEALRRRTPKP
jgi:hypothetical protein